MFKEPAYWMYYFWSKNKRARKDKAVISNVTWTMAILWFLNLTALHLLFGYNEERCKTADNIQPEQALTEQFPVFAHCLVLRLHRFQLRRTVIQLSGNPDKRGEHRCGKQVGNRVEPAPFHLVRQGREPARQHIPSPCLEQKNHSKEQPLIERLQEIRDGKYPVEKTHSPTGE